MQAFLALGACFTTYFVIGWWECAVWSVVYVGLLFSEKVAVRLVPDRPSPFTYYCILGLLAVEASVYCFMPVYFWYLGPDVAKFGALALITASTMHSMLHRAAFPSILMCFLIPDAAVFALIAVHSVVMYGVTPEGILYLIGGLTICNFFISMFFQAYQKEVSARREMQERQSAEAAKETSEARFRILFESAPIPIREEDLSDIKKALDELNIPDERTLLRYLDENPEFVKRCGQSIVVVNANRASVALHGYPNKSNMLSKVTRDLSPASVEVVRQTILAIHAGRTSLSYEIPIYTADGKVRLIAASWIVIAGHEKTYRRILLTSVDMTERAKSEERILKAQKMEAVGQLTGGIAHDFNNLLTVIGGNADLIQEDLGNARTYVEPIRSAVLRGSELTQRLLAFSRQQPLAPKDVDLTELIGDMAEILRRTLGENVAIDLRFDPNLWTVLADPNQIANALLNLGLNARDAMPHGGQLLVECANQRVEGREGDELADGDYVALTVSDTGSGMTSKALSHAFEPFFTTKSVGKGSGLGLSMVYGFAKQSNGHAEIESTLEVGTKVRILLPRGAPVLRPEEQTDPTLDPPKGKGQPILVLEDQDEVRVYLTQMLELMGYRPRPAGNAHEARALLDMATDIHVALCDIMLPGGISGTEFAAQALKDYPDLKVIFISGRPPTDHIATTGALKDTALLTKPFDSRRLADLLHQYFNPK